jgi:hypothetical protein
MDLEIKKDDTSIYIYKEDNGTITIENSYQDTMDLISVPINLTKEEAKRVIVQLQKYCE